MDEEYLPPPVPFSQACEKLHVGLPTENLIVFKIETRAVQIDCAEDLLSISLPGGRNQRLLSLPRPGSQDSWVLAKTGFVGKEQRRVVLSGFFLEIGRASCRERVE